MENKEIIQKLLELGWKSEPDPDYDDNDFYVWKKFEISESKELHTYTNYTLAPGEKIFIAYVIYPNRQVAEWFIWGTEDDYNITLELALEDRLFTYPQELKEENL